MKNSDDEQLEKSLENNFDEPWKKLSIDKSERTGCMVVVIISVILFWVGVLGGIYL